MYILRNRKFSNWRNEQGIGYPEAISSANPAWQINSGVFHIIKTKYYIYIYDNQL